MRFLADENISNHVIDKLHSDGHEVVSVARDRAGSPDTEVLGIATASDCVLITEDQDFGELVIRQRLPVRGIILLELDRLSNVAEAQRVSHVVSKHSDQVKGHLIVVEPSRIRVRRLPT